MTLCIVQNPFVSTTNMIWILIVKQFVTVLFSLCIPDNLRHKHVAGWNESACFFWHQLWVDCGCPSAGVTATIRKRTKQRYKAEARRRLRRQNYVRREKMGNTLAANRFRDFWKAVKKSKHCANKAPVIDGMSGDPQVPELWSTKFKNLYNHCDPSNRDFCWISFILL